MLNIKLNVAINDSDSFTFNNAAARIVGSKIVVEQGSECVMVTEFGNIKELAKVNEDGE